MGTAASIEKWSFHRLAAYSQQKNLPTYITKHITSNKINGAAILNYSEFDISRFERNEKRKNELWKHCMVLQRAANRHRSIMDDALSEISGTTDQSSLYESTRPPDELFHLPFHLRNEYFVGRQNDLEIIHTAFHTFHPPRDGKRNEKKHYLKCFALSGLGGIGKTALAAAYAKKAYYERRQYSNGVYFLNAGSLHESFVQLSIYQLRIKAARNENQIDVIKAYVHTWFRKHKRWLLIIDNVDDEEVFDVLLKERLFPPANCFGHVLITSRNQNHPFFKSDYFVNHGNVVPHVLAALSPIEACKFLFLRSRQKKISEFEIEQGLRLLEEDDPEEYYALYFLSAENGLAGLPLALEQAGAFLLHTEMPFQQYVQEFKKSELQILEKSNPEVGISADELESKKLHATFNMSLEQLPKRSVELLMILSFLDVDNISQRLVLTISPECPREDIRLSISMSHHGKPIRPWTKITFVESQYYNVLMDPLLSLSLLSVVDDNDKQDIKTGKVSSQMVSMHRMLKMVIQDKFSGYLEYKNEVVMTLLTRICKVFSFDGCIIQRTILEQNDRLNQSLDHLKSVISHATLLNDEDSKLLTANLWASCGLILGITRGNFAGSINCHFKALNLKTEVYRRQASNPKKSGQQSDNIKRGKTKLDSIEKILLETDDSNDKEATFGLENAVDLDGLPIHESIATTLSHIGDSLFYSKHVKQALKYYWKSLEMLRATSRNGARTLSIASSYNNIGATLHDLGLSDNAIEFFEESLQIFDEVYGKNSEVIHEDMASTLSNLGSAIGSIGGRIDEAIQYMLKSLVIQLKLHGNGKQACHPSVATCYNNLGALYEQVENLDSSQHYFETSLNIKYQLWGEDAEHISILKTCFNIGNVASKRRRYREAKDYFLRSMELNQKIHGVNVADKTQIQILENLGDCFSRLKEYKESRGWYQKSLVMLKSYHGNTDDVHPTVLALLMKISKSHIDECNGNSYKSIDLYRHILKCEQKLFRTQTGQAENAPDNQIHRDDNIDGDNGEDNDFMLLREHQDIADIYKYMSYAFVKSQNYNTALEYLQYAVKLEYRLYTASQIPNEHTIITKCISGEIFQGRGEYKKALKNFETALAQLYLISSTEVDENSKTKDKETGKGLDMYSPEENERIAYVLEKIGTMYLQNKKHYKCIDCLEHALSIYVFLKQNRDIERLRVKLFKICQADNRKEASLHYAEKICRHYKSDKSKRKEYIRSLYDVACCLIKLSHHSKALPLLVKGLSMAEDFYEDKKHSVVVQILDALSECQEKSGDIDSAFDTAFEAQTIDDALSNLGEMSRYRVRGIVTLQTATMLMLEYGDMKARHMAQLALKVGDLSLVDVRSPDSIVNVNSKS